MATHTSGWFMSDPFTPGRVYNQLVKSGFDYVVGLDIGHGESLAALYNKKTGRVDLLKLNADHDTKIPSYIHFDGDTAVVGRKAGNYPGFIPHFKVSPDHWEERRSGYTHRTLMGNFIRTLWNQILNYCDELRKAPKSSVMIVVGCPASPLWTSEKALSQYKDLVRQATHYPHVSILPESTAAILSVIHNTDDLGSKKQLRLNQGLAVLDAGSSTLDFTYVVLGKQLITRSLCLGGSNLDETMLDVILEQNGITRDQIPAEQISRILVQIRKLKEEFYPDRKDPDEISIHIWGKNPDGTANRQINSGLRLEVCVNQSFMSTVLNRKSIEVSGTLDDTKQSWLDAARGFLQNCYALIPKDSEGNPLCDHVLTTGGTSFVTELQTIIESIYGKDRTVKSLDPSSSVVKGLAHAKRLDIQGHDLVEQYRQDILALGEKAYEGLLEDLCRYIAETACDISRDTFLSLSTTPDKKKISLLMDKITQAAAKDPRLCGKDYDAKIQELFQKHFLLAYEDLRQKGNELSAGIYGSHLKDSLPQIPPLSRKDLLAISARLDLKGFVNKALLDPIVSDSIFSFIQGIALYATMVLCEFGQFVFAGITALIWALMGIRSIQDVIRQIAFRLPFAAFSNKQLQELAARMDTPHERKELVDKITHGTIRDIAKALKDKAKIEQKEKRQLRDPRPMHQTFLDCLSQQAEVILGKLLFLVYDEQPDTGE